MKIKNMLPFHYAINEVSPTETQQLENFHTSPVVDMRLCVLANPRDLHNSVRD